MTTDRVREEWARRVSAEYGSCAITQQLTLWLTQIGASPDLIRAGFRIAEDELVHAELSHAVLQAAGGSMPGPVDRAGLSLPRRGGPLELDVLFHGVRVFCLGETIAVPLFAALRQPCTEPVAQAAFDRVLVDEVRHRDYGWMLLDWFLEQDAGFRGHVQGWLPEMLGEVRDQYASPNADPAPVTEVEARWGLMDAAGYAEVFETCCERHYEPLFEARGVGLY